MDGHPGAGRRWTEPRLQAGSPSLNPPVTTMAGGFFAHRARDAPFCARLDPEQPIFGAAGRCAPETHLVARRLELSLLTAACRQTARGGSPRLPRSLSATLR
jgi:hypothetical protein